MQSNFIRWPRLLAWAGALLMLALIAKDARAGQANWGAANLLGSDHLGGVWRGKWHSQPTGHQGPLGARIRPAGPDRYVAWFYGRFAGVIPFAYRTSLTRVAGTADRYQARQRLLLFGTYTTTARISGDHFRADFSSGKDRGTFIMTRRR